MSQSAHLSKKQFSLHCIVKHTSENERMYMYHLSDVQKHDFAFTSTGIYICHSLDSLVKPIFVQLKPAFRVVGPTGNSNKV